MKTVFLGILLLFQSGINALKTYSADGEIKNFAVGNEKVFIVTDSHLLQMKHNLTEEKHKIISNLTHPNTINILLPFETNKTLIICGTYDCGYCEVLDIEDITNSIYKEEVSVGALENESSVAFLVDFDNDDSKIDTYMLVSRQKEEKIKQRTSVCPVTDGVLLINTLESQPGRIFSKIDSRAIDAKISPIDNVEWIDGFQTPPSHSYLLVNVNSAVMVLKMNNNKTKSEMTRSLTGATLKCCDDKDRTKLVSSSVVFSSGSPLLCAGIFTAQNTQDPENTALAVYDFSQIGNQVPSGFTCSSGCTAKEGKSVLIPRDVVFKHSSMTSVLAEKKGSWIILYFGTADGQLMKVLLDKTFMSGCVRVLYRSDDDMMVFPRMHFDPVDRNYIYIASKNEISRVAVTQCGMYSTLRDCRDSQDPNCGWCVNTNKCSSRDECLNSSWIFIREDTFQKELISFHVTEENLDVVTLNLQLSVDGTEKPNLTCTFMVGDADLCESLDTVFPKCVCKFSNQRLPLNVTARVSIGDQKITENLKLKSCPDIKEAPPFSQCLVCVSAGCHWSNSTQTCSWTTETKPQQHKNDVCTGLSSGNYTPQIFSVEPNEVSFHGKKNVVIKGKNLDLVTKIRFQGFMECTSKESPVLERSTDSLKFNIPSGNKGRMKVCVVTEDGHCHSSATITYHSQPTCTGLQHTNTWSRRTLKV